MKKILFIMSAFLVALVVLDAQAQSASDKTETVHGIAMHGVLKYKSGFTHFDYVNPNAPKKGNVALSALGTFDSLNEFITKGNAATGLSLTYDTLLKSAEDEAFSEYGLLAKSMTVPEDRSWVIFHLRPEAKWHDGRPITPEDVIFSMKILKQEGAPFFKQYYKDVVNVEKVGPDSVKFSFKDGLNRELVLIVGQMPILSKHYFDTHTFNETFLTPALGSGPYKIVEVKPGKSITYQRVPDYWGKDLPVNKGQYNFDRVTYDYYRDPTVALEAFKAHDYDFREENNSKLWARAYQNIKEKDGLHVVTKKIAHEMPRGMQGFAFNLRHPLFKDKRVRKALTLLFDFEWSNRSLFYNQYVRTDSYFENSELASSGLPKGEELALLLRYKDALPMSVFNEAFTLPQTKGDGNIRPLMRQALALLNDAGWQLQAGKLIHKKSKQPFRFDILLASPAFKRIVLPFTKNLAKIGIDATVKVVNIPQYVNQLREFKFDMVVVVIGQSLSPGNEQRNYWTRDAATKKGSRNVMGIQNDAIDALVDQVIYAKDRQQLLVATKALDRALLHNYYVIPHWHINYFRVAYWDMFMQPNVRPKYGLGFFTWWVS